MYPNPNLRVRFVVLLAAVIGGGIATLSWAYPPAVGITSRSRNCGACHQDTGPWRDDAALIVDILDAQTRVSTRRPDGAFLLSVPRGETRRYLTVIGRAAADTVAPPERNGWAYVDPTQIGTASLSKFAPNWEIDLPMSCRMVGDTLSAFPNDHVTVVPMNVRPLAGASAADVELQLMLTSGQSVKNRPNDGLTANYFMRRVRLEVTDPDVK
ncbi:MAG TPA: hypothetical protein VNN55_00685 [bacterium]|nr:hypothetical protein [bacterium]